MSISSISSSSAIGATINSSSTSTVQALEKQLKDVNKQIEDETTSKDSAKVKEEKLAALQQEATLIEMKISQAKQKQAKAGDSSAANSVNQPASAASVQDELTSVNLVA